MMQSSWRSSELTEVPLKIRIPTQLSGRFLLQIRLRTEVEQPRNAVVISLALLSKNEDRIENPLNWPISERLKLPYKYFGPFGPGASVNTITMSIDDEVSNIELTIVKWRPQGTIYVDDVRLDMLARGLKPAPWDRSTVSDDRVHAPLPNNESRLVRNSIDLSTHCILPLLQSRQYSVEGGYEYSMNIHTDIQDENRIEKAFILRFRFVDDFDAEQPLETGQFQFHRSECYGTFIYLSAGITKWSFITPMRGRFIQIQAESCNAKAGNIYLPQQLSLKKISPQVIREKLRLEIDTITKAGTSDGTFVIIYTGTRRIRDDNRANRSMMFAQELERLGIPTIYTFSSRPGELHFGRDSDCLLQVPVDMFEEFATSIAQGAPGKQRILLGSFPDQAFARLVGNFRIFGWTVIYECRDDWEEFAAAGVGKWYQVAFERYAVLQAELTFCVSPPLQRRMQRYVREPNRVRLSPNAAADQIQAAGRDMRAIRKNEAGKRFRRAGYFGHLTEHWFDWAALIFAASNRPDVTFELAGFDIPSVELPPNIRYLGSLTHSEIVEVSGGWDVGIIPFKVGRLSRAVDPIKAYEYLALGLRIVAPEMGQLIDWPMTFCYSEFELGTALDAALRYVPNEGDWSRVETLLERATWNQRLVDLLEAVGVELPRRPLNG
jgi:hypothetical protein